MTSGNPPGPDRAARQRDLVPPARLAEVHAVVIGVGAVGRQVALQLAAMGVPKMTLYDPDTVEIENLAPQGFWETDVGDYKVYAVANVAHQEFPQMDLTAVPDRFRRSEVRTAGACTAKSTIYAASVAAGLLLAQFARWLSGQPVTPDQVLNLLAAELTVAEFGNR
jgi:sulfur carrier protein ThiS adenylyltransferase